MATVSELNVVITAETGGLTTGLNSAERSISDSVSSMARQAATLGAALTAAVTLPIGAVAALGVSFNAMREQAEVAFTQLLGSGQKADAFLRELAQFAAVTPFEFPELVKAAQKFTAIGVEAKNVIPIMTALGDAVSAFGGTSEDINRVTVQLVQMIGKGKVSMQDLRVIADSVPAAVGAMAEKLGISVQEMFKKMEKGSLSAAEGVTAMLVGLEEKFHGQMEKQSQTFNGLMSTLKDTVRFAAGDITESLFGILKGGLKALVDYLPIVVAAFKGIPEQVKLMTLAIAGVAAAIGPALVVIGGLVMLLGGPLTLVIIGVTGLMTVLAAAVALNFSRIVSIVSASSGMVRINFVEIAGYAGAVLDAFQVLARGAIAVFDIIVTGAVMMAQGVKAAFDGIKDAGRAAFALANNDMTGFASAMGSMAGTTLDAAKSIGQSLRGLATRGISDLKDISAHASGTFAKSFAVAAAQAGQSATTFSRKWQEVTEDIKGAFKKVEDGAKEGADKAGGHVDRLQDKVKKAMKDIAQSIEQGLVGQGPKIDAVGQIIHAKLIPFIDELNIKIAKSKEIIEPTTTAIRGFGDVTVAVATHIKGLTTNVTFLSKAFETDLLFQMKQTRIAFEGMVIDENAAADAAETLQDATDRAAEALRNQFTDLSRSIPHALNDIIDAFGRMRKTTEEEFEKFGVKVKGVFADIFQVVGNLPGKIGDALRKGVSEFEHWVATINGILGLLHRIFNSIPANLGDAITQVIGIFKKTTSAVQSGIETATSHIGTIWDNVAKVVTSGGVKTATEATKAGAAIGQNISSGLKDFLSSAAGIAAAVAGAISLSLGTFQSESKYKRFLGSFALGGPIGGLLAVIFGGPSELQKAQMAAQLQQAKDAIKLSQESVAQAFEATKQSIIETAGKARELLESITFYTQVPKDAFKAFFRDLDKLMQYFAERAKAWAASASPNIKAFADDMKAVMEGIAQAPTALINIGKYLGIPEASMVRFFADLGKVLETFGALGEDFTRKFLRHTRQFAERIGDAVALIPDITAGITGLVDIKPIPIGNLDIWEAALKEVTNRIGVIAENFDKNTAKVIGFFAEKVGPAIDLWKNSIEALKSMVDLPTPTGQDFDNLFESIRTALEGMSDLASTMSTEALVKAQSIAETSLSIFAAIKAAVEALGGLRDYKSVAQEAIDAIIADFKRGVVLLNLLILDATDFEDKAKKFRDIVLSGAAALNEGITAYVGSLTGMAKSLLDLPQGGVPLGPASQFTSLSKGQQGMTVQMQIDVHGSILSENELDDRIWEGFMTNLRRSGLTLATA